MVKRIDIQFFGKHAMNARHSTLAVKTLKIQYTE